MWNMYTSNRGLRPRGCVLPVQVIRPMFSNPPRFGAAIVVTVLSDPELYALWRVCPG